MRLILCPLKKEWTLLAQALESKGLELIKKQNQGKWYFEVPAWNAVVAIAGHGNKGFTEGLNSWAQYFGSIDQIIATGSAGALLTDLKIGDILLIKKITEHDSQETPLPVFPLTALPLDQTFPDFKVHRSSLASGDENITSTERKKQLLEQTGADAVTWESAGGIQAALKLNIPYFELRGITDYAEGDGMSEFSDNLAEAMDHCGQVLNSLLK